MPCTEVLCKHEAWWWGCARIGGGVGSGGGGCTGWGPPGQDTVEGLIDQLWAARSSWLLPHSFLTPVALGGVGASWATVEELRFGPKAHGALRLRDQCRWAVRDRTVMLRTHLSGPTRLLRKMNW